MPKPAAYGQETGALEYFCAITNLSWKTRIALFIVQKE
jgi:hypothetical protein